MKYDDFEIEKIIFIIIVDIIKTRGLLDQKPPRGAVRAMLFGVANI